MQTAQFVISAQVLRNVVFGILVLTTTGSSLSAQNEVKELKSLPRKNEVFLFLVNEAVVQIQWPHTLNLVNAPGKVKLLNPGQCIRAGVVATGDNRDEYLDRTKLSFRVKFSGQNQDHPLAPLAQTKQIKPEGGDFVTEALAAGGIKNPLLTTASMGVSADNWCVPADAVGGSATVEAEVETPAGHKTLKPATLQIEGYETGSKRQFKDAEEASNFLMHYHWEPNPARLFPALQSLAAVKSLRENPANLESSAVTFGSALKASPAAAQDFMTRISSETGFTRAFGLLALLEGGYDIGPVLKAMSDEDRQKFAQRPDLPDPYDFSHVEDIGAREDMLWGIFMTTGDIAPLQQITSALKWRADWDDLQKARKSSNPPKEWTPAIGRAVGYAAAGWSLGSFQRTDPLAADYIEYMTASPDTPPAIKSELTGLFTNPAFRETKTK
jgi:hypothetical protein